MSDMFKDLETPDGSLKPNEVNSGMFSDLENKVPQESGMFKDLEEPIKEDQAPKPLLKAMTDLAISGPMGPALQGYQAQSAAEQKIHGGVKQDPIYFTKRDLPAKLIPEPLTTLGVGMKVINREEATFANPGVEMVKKAQDVVDGKTPYLQYIKEAPSTILGAIKEGLEGHSRSEVDPTRQAQLGDIYRALGAPEPVAATLGLATSLALPTQILMNFISPGGKIISRAENIAKDAIRIKALQTLAKQDSMALLKNKQAIIEHLGITWPKDTHIYLAKYKQDLLKAASDDEIKSILGEAKLAKPRVVGMLAEREAAKPKSLMQNLVAAAHEHMYFPYAIKSMLNAKSWDHPVLKQVRNAQAAVTHMESGINNLVTKFSDLKKSVGITGDIPEALGLEIKANQLLQEGEVKKLATLLKHNNLSSVPALSKEGNTILEGTRTLLNEGREVIAVNYEKHYGMPFKVIENHSFPITYVGEEVLPLDLYKPSSGARAGVKGTFKTRVSSNLVPATDLDKQFIQQARAQEMLRYTVPAVDDMRAFMSQKHVAPLLTNDQHRFIENRLEFVLRGGNEIPKNIVEAGLRTGSKNVVKGMLGFKVASAIMQPTAYLDAMNFATQTWGRGAGRSMLASARELLLPSFKKKTAEALDLRLGMSGADISLKESGKAGSIGMKPLQLLDWHTAKAARNGMERYLVKNKIPHTPDDLDFFMELAQGSSNTMLQPGVMTHGYTLKAWYTFQTFVLGRYSRMAVDALQQGIFVKDAERRAAIALDHAMLTKPELLRESLPKTNWTMLSANKSEIPGLDAKALEAVNKAAKVRMAQQLKKYGYRAQETQGGWKNPITGTVETEPSFFVPGMREDDAIKIAREANQVSIKTNRGEIFLDTMKVKPNDYRGMKIEIGSPKTSAIADSGEGFTDVMIGGKNHRISIPTGAELPEALTPDRLTAHVQPHDVIDRRINGFIGLAYVAAAEAAEQAIRSGVYELTTGKKNPKTLPQALMMAIPSQVPVFSALLQSAMYGGTGLPPVVSTLSNIVKGTVGTFKGKTPNVRARNLIKAAASTASLLGGVQGAEQASQIAQAFLREKK